MKWVVPHCAALVDFLEIVVASEPVIPDLGVLKTSELRCFEGHGGSLNPTVRTAKPPGWDVAKDTLFRRRSVFPAV